jgi:chromosome segregation ATPase
VVARTHNFVLQTRFIQLTEEKLAVADELETLRHRSKLHNIASTQDALPSLPTVSVSPTDNEQNANGDDALQVPHVPETDDSVAASARSATQADEISSQLIEQLQERIRALEQQLEDSKKHREFLEAKFHHEEHIAQQLAGEAATISDYIALYRKERETLKARNRERDEYVQELLATRAELENQLAALKNVLRQMIAAQPYPSLHMSDGGLAHAPVVDLTEPHHDAGDASALTSPPPQDILREPIHAVTRRPLVNEFPACEHCQGGILRL